MQKLIKITIEGDYWDCQIYRGRLYLWTFNGKVITYNWDKLVDSINNNDNENLTVTCAFKRGDYLYNSDFQLFFQNNEIKNVLKEQFNILSTKEIQFDMRYMNKFLRGEQDIPTPELPVDTDIYNNIIFSADQTGLYNITAHRTSNKYPISSKPKKIWDCPLLSIKVGNRGNMALSAGNEGLFEYITNEHYNINFDQRAELISKNHSTFSNWAFSSIYSSSISKSAYLAPFYYKDYVDYNNVDYNLDIKRSDYFVSKDVIDETRIFGNKAGFSWACNEKFYKYYEGTINIVNFKQSGLEDGDEAAFFNKREIILDAWKGDVISSGVGYFGIIIECENAIIVLLSDGSSITIPGRAVRWRVYPRTIRYENHLHVIRDNSIEIYSFNNDYFINQKSKNYGIEYRNTKSGNQWRLH